MLCGCHICRVPPMNFEYRTNALLKFGASQFYPYASGYLQESFLCICPANERWHYIVTLSPIRWAHTQNDPCISLVLAQSYPCQFTNTPPQQCHDIFYFYVVTNVALFTWLHVWDISVLRVIIESFPDSIIISLRIICQHTFLVYCHIIYLIIQLICIKMVWHLVL